MGYEALTDQEVTDRADVARPTCSVYSDGKEAAVGAVLPEHVQGLVTQLGSVADLHGRQQRHVKWIGMFQFAQSQRDLLQVVLSEGVPLTAEQMATHLGLRVLGPDPAGSEGAR